MRNGKRSKRRLHERQVKAEKKAKAVQLQTLKRRKKLFQNSGEVDGREAPFLFVRCYGNAWACIHTVSAGRKL